MNDELDFSDVTAPPAASLLARTIYAVVEGYEGARILSLGPRGAAMELGTKATMILLVWDADNADLLAHNLGQVMKQRSARGRLVVGLVGGGEDARRVLEEARPTLTQIKIGQVHVSDGGKVWSRDVGAAGKALSHFVRTAGPSEDQWKRLVAKSAAEIAEFEDRTREAQEFMTVLQSRRPIATWTLAGLIAVVFGLEYLFGGTQSPPVLLRMGALSPEKVAAGEWWRLFSCTFLHSGPLHVLFNTYVLWILGTQLERILGTARFLVLYGTSCLGASLVSLAFLDGFSVGASGGLWGLLGAEALLAWRSDGLLPRAMIPGARKAAVVNLGINVLNSFRPHVDMWAHFGGGAVGAALMLSGVLTRGVPRLGELEAAGRLGSGAPELRTGPVLRAAGATAAFVLVLGLALGLANGRPWDLQRPVETQRMPIPELGISLELPRGLAPSPASQDGSVQVGDLRSDPGAVLVTRYAADLSDASVLAREREALAEQIAKTPAGGRRTAGPENVAIAGAPGVTVTYRYDSGIEEELAFVFLADAMVKVDILRWPEFGDAVPAGYAVRVLDSLQPIVAEAERR
jgi:membrane associated rhomboid family serine protease